MSLGNIVNSDLEEMLSRVKLIHELLEKHAISFVECKEEIDRIRADFGLGPMPGIDFPEILRR